MRIINKIKKLLTRKKSAEALKMWEGLCAAPTEPSKSLDIDVGHYMSLQTQREKDQYFIECWNRR